MWEEGTERSRPVEDRFRTFFLVPLPAIVPVLRPLSLASRKFGLPETSRISHNRAHIFGKIWRKRILTLTPIYPPISRHVHRSCLDTYLCFFFLLRPLEGINSTRVRLSKLSHPILISHAPTLCGFDIGNARRRKK